MTPPAVARPDPYATAALVDEVRELAERAAEEILGGLRPATEQRR